MNKIYGETYPWCLSKFTGEYITLKCKIEILFKKDQNVYNCLVMVAIVLQRNKGMIPS